MKLLHLGDLHLGKSLGDFDLIDDQKYILNQILLIIEQEAVDGVLIAGDIYDRSIPSEAAMNLLDYFLCSLAEREIKAYIVSGNHDSDDRLNYGSRLFSNKQIYISSKYDGNLYKQTIADEYGNINIYLLPFVKASLVRHFFPDENIETYDDAIRTIIKNADINTTERNIIVAHQFVIGRGEKTQFGGSESAATQSVGTVEMIGSDCFEDFDYVALGHIHSAQRVGRDEIRYSGSPLKYSLSEVNNNKSVPIITIADKGQVDIKLIPLQPQRDVRHIKGQLATLLSEENVCNTNDFIYATLTDEDIINDAMGIFQQTYPNTVKIDYDNSHSKEIEDFDITEIEDEIAFPELISNFYKMVYGCEISDDEMAIIMEVAREVGVDNETN